MGTLYVVGTPIGNLGDLSARAAETLASVSAIAAEDTRVTARLLARFGLRTETVSYREHNAARMGPELLNRLLAGQDLALVTDAGMPCISDPGERLVRLCHEHRVPVVAVPGPTAVMTALAVSGLPARHFVFEGFLPVRKGDRSRRLALLAPLSQTLVFYEAPHRLRTTLRDLLDALGDRPVCLCRELTKAHEEAVPSTLAEAVRASGEREPRGEYVIVVAGAPEVRLPDRPLEEAAALVLKLAGDGRSLSEAAREASKETSYPKTLLYRKALNARDP